MSDEQDTKKNSGLYEEPKVYGVKKETRTEKKEYRSVRFFERRDRSFHRIAVFVMAGFALVILIAMIAIVRDIRHDRLAGGTNRQAVTEPEHVEHINTPDFFGIVLNVDKAEHEITVCNVENDETDVFFYDGVSKFYGRAGSQITAGVLSVGDILRFSVREADEKYIKTAAWSDKIWEKQKVDDLKIDDKEHKLMIRNVNYRYSDDMCIISNGQVVSMDSLLTDTDVYTVRGYDNTVCEIIVTTGHGTLSLLNYEKYLGGSVLIGPKYLFDIEDDATYVVREGTYMVTASFGRLEKAMSIEIPRDAVAYMDLKEYVPEDDKPDTGFITDVAPKLQLPDDVTFNMLSLKRLKEKYEYDADHAIYIYGPLFGDLYVGNEYFGKIPCDFEKFTGEVELTVIYDEKAATFIYNGAEYTGDSFIDYSETFKD